MTPLPTVWFLRPTGQILCLTALLLTLPGCQPQNVPPGTVPAGPGSVPSPETKPAANLPPLTNSAPVASADSEVPVVTGPVPQYLSCGADVGLEFTRFDDISPQRRIMESTGGGVAVWDFDRDGILDITLTNGCRIPVQSADLATPSQLFRNLDRERFSNISAAARFEQSGYAQGCAVGDFDNDGFDDLFIAAFGDDAFWLNNGDGTLTNSSTTAQAPGWSTSVACADVNQDGHLDLYVANYLAESDQSPRLCPNTNSPDGFEGCSPALFDGAPDVLLLGEGTGQFRNVSAASQIDRQPGKGLGVVISDLDRDGSPDIYVANDGEANFLFVKDPAAGDEFRLRDIAFESGVALNERGYAQAGMGIAIGDCDQNGFNDLYLTHFYGDTNTLYCNQGGQAFVEETRRSGLGAMSRLTLGFGTVFTDFDNDGRLDLFAANGHVDDRTWKSPGEPYAMPPQFFRNDGGLKFMEVSSLAGDYFRELWLGRGVANGDLNRDGLQDLVISHQLRPSVMLRNATPEAGHSLVLRLVGRSGNRSAFGAIVTQTGSDSPAVYERVGGGSYQSACALEVHVGLGAATHGNLTIQWPQGIRQACHELAAGTWVIVEGEPPRPWIP